MVPLDRLSRFLSFLLRHRPAEYPIAFDRQGFVAWSELFRRVQGRFPDATEDDIRKIVTATDKQRFELRGDKVRATYGHSFPVHPQGQNGPPPERLYYGNPPSPGRTIFPRGTQPQRPRLG